MPIGIIAIPITFTSLSRERIISVCCFFLDAFASSVIFDAYDESPTFSRTARHSPDTTKLPDNSISPFFFVISSDSPVTSDSLTLTIPSTTTASAQIWFPDVNLHKSPFTSVCESTSDSFPFLITLVLGALRSVSLSSTRLVLSSCIIPISVFITIIGRKVILIYDLTRINKHANIANIKLKYVNTLPATIWHTLLDWLLTVSLKSPSAVNLSTCSCVRPLIVSVSDIYLFPVFYLLSCYRQCIIH